LHEGQRITTTEWLNVLTTAKEKKEKNKKDKEQKDAKKKAKQQATALMEADPTSGAFDPVLLTVTQLKTVICSYEDEDEESYKRFTYKLQLVNYVLQLQGKETPSDEENENDESISDSEDSEDIFIDEEDQIEQNFSSVDVMEVIEEGCVSHCRMNDVNVNNGFSVGDLVWFGSDLDVMAPQNATDL